MEVPSDNKARYVNRRRQFYVGGLILLALITVAEVVFYYETLMAASLYFASCIVMGTGPLAWCIYDGLARGFRMSYHRWLLWVLLGPFVITAYFLKTRGMARSARSLFGLVLYVSYYAVFFAVWHLTGEVLVKVGYFSPE